MNLCFESPFFYALIALIALIVALSFVGGQHTDAFYNYDLIVRRNKKRRL